jgi:hypothetical protein
MPFSAQTCITNTGTTSLGGVFTIYTASTGPFGVFQTGVPISSLVPPNCPYIFVVPDGTTQIRFLDDLTGCYIDMPISGSNLCETCDIDFSLYQQNQIGVLSSGLLTGDCQNNITDYFINWYGPDSTTNLAFTSGYGNIFSGYTWTHPLTGSSSVPVTSGVYTPIINQIIVNNLTYSLTGGSQNVISCLDCLNPINVDYYKCDNETNTNTNYPYSGYNHFINFNTTISGPAVSVSTSLLISASTNFIFWSFRAFAASDRIKISFSGQNYNTIIGLEDIWVGNLISSNNFNVNNLPYSAITQQFFSKITTLTGLTVSDGDRIIIEITPSDPSTNWQLYFTCSSTYDCEDCLTDNSYYKIIGSTLSAQTGSCNTNLISFRVSGCTYEDFANSDYIKYYINSLGLNNPINNGGYPFNSITSIGYTPGVSPTTNNTIQPLSFGLVLSLTNTVCNNSQRIQNNTSCVIGGSSSPTEYNISQTPGGNAIFNVTGNSTVISSYYQQWESYKITTFGGYTFNPDPNDIEYFGYFSITFPNNSTPDNCADPTSFTNYSIHPSSIIITGTTGSDYFLSITSTTISDINVFGSCDIGCASATANITNTVNNQSTGTTSFYKNFNSGFYFQNFIRGVIGVTSGITQTLQKDLTGNYFLFDYESNTYPFSGSPYTLIPSLSASVCTNYISGGNESPYFNTTQRRKYKYFYRVRLTNLSDVNDFDISASTISNGAQINPFILVYRYSGGSVVYSDPVYII